MKKARRSGHESTVAAKITPQQPRNLLGPGSLTSISQRGHNLYDNGRNLVADRHRAFFLPLIFAVALLGLMIAKKRNLL
jgi:hypothetical protein